jgi:hypothetical protein
LFAAAKPDNPASALIDKALIFQILRILSLNHPESMSMHNKTSYIFYTKQTPEKTVYIITLSERETAPVPKGRELQCRETTTQGLSLKVSHLSHCSVGYMFPVLNITLYLSLQYKQLITL